MDVDTGFWLWLAALPLFIAGQISDGFITALPDSVQRTTVVASVTVMMVGLGAVIATLLFLLRSGYRWARAALTAGGVATVIYTVIGLFGMSREPVPAFIFAVTGIIGCVLICGGVFLLYRPDSNRFFTR